MSISMQEELEFHIGGLCITGMKRPEAIKSAYILMQENLREIYLKKLDRELLIATTPEKATTTHSLGFGDVSGN